MRRANQMNPPCYVSSSYSFTEAKHFDLSGYGLNTMCEIAANSKDLYCYGPSKVRLRLTYCDPQPSCPFRLRQRSFCAFSCNQNTISEQKPSS